MPDYSYFCPQCEKQFEQSVDFSKRDSIKCSCGALAERIFSASDNLFLKGEWSLKNFKEKKYRSRRAEYFEDKQKEQMDDKGDPIS